MEQLTWDHVLWEIAFSVVFDLLILGLLLPFIIKVVKRSVNKDRDRRHGH